MLELKKIFFFFLIKLLISQKGLIKAEDDVPCGVRYSSRSLSQNESALDNELSDNGYLNAYNLESQYPFKNNSVNDAMLIKYITDLDKIKNKLAYIQKYVIIDSKTDFYKVDNILQRINSLFELQYIKKILKNNLYNQIPIYFEDEENNLSSNISLLSILAKDLMMKIQKEFKVKRRIVGGTQANIKEFPWLVSIQLENGGHICGGSIINSRWIATASHCVVKPESNQLIDDVLIISVGSSYWKKGKKHRSVKIIRHPEFTYKSFFKDIALIKVEPEIQLQRGRTVPICLPPPNTEITGTATIAGWGLVDNDGSHPNDFLMRVNVNLLRPDICQARYQNWVSKVMICAGHVEGGKDSCQGDSGGPLQSILINKKIHLIGITSFGDDCGRPGFPGVYSKVSSFIDWIKYQIENN